MNQLIIAATEPKGNRHLAFPIDDARRKRLKSMAAILGKSQQDMLVAAVDCLFASLDLAPYDERNPAAEPKRA